MALSPIKMNVNAAPVEAADQQKLLGVTPEGDLVQVEVDLNLKGVPAGAQGQLVGYDAQGNPVAVAPPAVADPYDDSALVQTISAQGQRLLAAEEVISSLPEPVDLAPLTGRVVAVEEGLAAVAQPYDDALIRADLASALARLEAAEAMLADLPEGVDLSPIQTEIAQLKARIDGLDGGFVNRPPTSSAIPTQSLTLGTPFVGDFSGYFDDPDGHALNAADVSGTLPPGITQDGFVFSGTPTQTGNFTVILAASDLYGAQASRSIAWAVATSSVPRDLRSEPGAYTMLNPGTLNQVTPAPAVGGYTLEIV